MHIREIDPAESPADLAAVLPVWSSAFAHAMPDLPVPGEVRLRNAARAGEGVRLVCLAAFPDEGAGQAVGLAIYTASTTANLDVCRSTLLVAPQAERHGVGSALLAAQLDVAATEGRQRLIMRGPASTSATGFAQRHEGRLVGRDTMSVLDVRNLDLARFEAWAAPSGKNLDYRVIHWDDRCPDEVAESFCHALDAMADAPSTLRLERVRLSIENLRASEERFARAGVHRHVVAALDASGTIVGYCMTATVDGEPELAEVWNTAVLREHRGRGLALRLKAAQTLHLRDSLPEIEWFNTFNNEANEPMLRVNRTLGYRAHTDWVSIEFAITR